MLKISEKSWHYRLYKWGNDKEPKSLCDYFWTVLFSVPIFLIVMLIEKILVPTVRVLAPIAFAIFAGYVMLYLPVSIWMESGYVWFPVRGVKYVTSEANTDLLVAVICWTLAALAGTVKAGVATYRSLVHKAEQGSSFATLALARLKSFREKTCPRIEVIK